ncbi:FG-GAP-like repeat-containing protein [Streptomyces sp. NPDC046900]|uniref:FG-GAP-like repeat-containing protein n=1 Tax=Streptomyces sp. NPDC046900 TaxID=3155473 RepID=UPI0034119674
MGKTRSVRLGVAVGVAAAAAAGALLMPVDAVAKPIAAPADFNGDGYRDLVVPAPTAKVGGKDGAGAVVVLYGSKSGVSASRKVVITQNTAKVPDSAETGDGFGASTAFADLDKDGYGDLIVGAPDEDLGSAKDAGSVTVLWGGKSGLSAVSTLPVPRGSYGRYGLDVAAVRDSGGARVLVAGYAGSIEFSGTFTRAGSARIATLYPQTGSAAVVEYSDFNHDGRAERIVTSIRAGGYSGGLVYIDPRDGSHVPLSTDGRTTAVGDVNGDGYNDLVVGDPDEPRTGTSGHRGGELTLWYGGPQGLAAKPVHISQDTPGVSGTSHTHYGFGTAVAVADLNKDGLADIVVGVPGQTQNNQANAGVVVVIPGKKTGTPGVRSYQLSQETVSVPGTSAQGDGFGTTLAVGDLNRDGHPDVVVGAPGEDHYRGAVWVLPGTSTHPTGKGSVELTAAKLGVGGESPQVGGFQPV